MEALYIEEHLNETLELETLAKVARISPYYFHRLFRIYVEETVAEYIKRLRLQKAAKTLQYSNSSITEIALDTGYESSSAFTKAFNQVMGQSPSQYRKTMQPLLKTIIKKAKSTKKEKSMLKPYYVELDDEEILFVRETGDYNETPDKAFPLLKQFLAEEGLDLSHVKAFYGIALDDHHIVERTKCRFDACVSLKIKHNEKGLVGRKILRGGQYAVFNYYGNGSAMELEETLDNILRIWYPTLKEETLGNSVPFFEFVHCVQEITSETEKLTKIYIPIQKR